MVAYRVMKTLDDFKNESVVLVDSELRIVEEVTLFLNHLEQRGYSENTIKMYSRNLRMYYEWLEYRGIEYLNITRRNIVDFIDYLKKPSSNIRSPKTVNSYLATISSFYDYLNIIQEEVETNPIKTSDGDSGFSQLITDSSRVERNLFRQREPKETVDKRLSSNEVQELYNAIEEIYSDGKIALRNKLIFKFLYETGTRVGECMGLRINDYSLPDPMEEVGFIYIRRHEHIWHADHNIKTLERDIPVSMDLINGIEEYVIGLRPQRDEIDTIFVNHRGPTKGKYLRRDTMTDLFNRISDKTGIKCTAHMLRHTHGTELIESGYDQEYVQERLGHSSILSTNQYIHLSLEAKTEAYERFLETQKKRG